ncbi:helix-turn-helix domain-containing protein [Nocardioides bruguierae]|uniref:helix-turn-helix domain-containing protein n=1 Tax=Nocardioides bruguierae TaxID=2945102 RepID=UPI003556D6AE
MCESSPIAYSVKTAAILTDLSESTIRDAINKQELPAYLVGRAPRILREDLLSWLTHRPARP